MLHGVFMDSTQFTQARTKVLRWSQQRLADELGMARNSVSRMESGVMPVERRTELALRWLMYSECNIVEQPAASAHQVSEPAPCNMVEQSEPVSQVADFQDTDYFRSLLLKEGVFCSEEIDRPLADMIERYNIIMSEFPQLAGSLDFTRAYSEFGFKNWLNIRGLRGAVRQYLETHQS